MHNSPVFKEVGQGAKRLFVMAPVMPVWDEGAFFQPLSAYFCARGYRVVLFDSLSLIGDEAQTFDAFSARWAQVLAAWGPPDLLAGAALGGALAQALVQAPVLAATPALLLLSSPTLATATLDQRLGGMADLAEQGAVAQAKQQLDNLVLPEGRSVPPDAGVEDCSPAALQRQGMRLTQGFRLLGGLDVRQSLEDYPGRVLSVFGERSQLVGAANIQLKDSPQQRALSIPGGGMRPLADNLPRVIGAIEAHLLEPLECSA